MNHIINFNLKQVLVFIAFLLFFSCKNDSDFTPKDEPKSSVPKLFELKKSDETGIDFTNKITETNEVNYFTFMHIYMGSGVAVGDFNNDNLQDIYFVSNMESDEIYLNEGGLKFKKIGFNAGISTARGFKTGVTVADVNGDGLDDIYVCRSGWFNDLAMKKNLLYINQGVGENGIPTFKESADQFGLGITNNSIQSSFFDYDNDGDLDVFVINTPVNFDYTNRLIRRDDIHKDEALRALNGFDQLFENDGSGNFKEVTKKAGIQSDIAFGLSVLTVDFNNDGWTDIYVCDDFMSPDYFYMNNGNGTFREVSESAMKHTSYYSMGADAGDINNDGMLDLFVLDMMPEDYKRSKISMSMTKPEKFFTMADWGFHYQYMHNVLQLNNGNETFSEIAQMASIEKTDWSWTPLIADFDNDGHNDIFITNGARRDVTNLDYRGEIEKFAQAEKRQPTLQEILDMIPSQKLSNYAFSNNGDLTFKKVSREWGLGIPSFSVGAATADLDGDGDLDLVTNNMEDEAFVFENKSVGGNYLRIKPIGRASGLNAKVSIKNANDELLQFKELNTTRGYMSGSEKVIHFGLETNENISKVEVVWNDGKKNILKNVAPNQVLEVNYSEAKSLPTKKTNTAKIFKETTASNLKKSYAHQENEFDDYKNQVLLPHRQSRSGPAISAADVNGDGREDFHVCGAHRQAGQLYLQNADGSFSPGNNQAFSQDSGYEDVGSTFLDVDLDGDLDLYVVSGGFEFPVGTNAFQDRLYVNDGAGNFTNLSMNTLPRIGESGSCAKAADFNGDGVPEIFVGSRVIPDKYPFAPSSQLLVVQNGRYENLMDQIAPELKNIGMVTDAVWTDFDNDEKIDLIVIGEWMNIEFFKNENNQLKRVTDALGFSETTGWWNKIVAADLDGDGDQDFVLGNLGLNYKYHASKEKPFHVFCDDFDNSGTYDIVLAKNYDDELLPIRGKTCSSEQMPFVGQKYPTFGSFAEADVTDIYGDKLKTALHYEAQLFESIILENTGSGFEIKKLPKAAQIAPINGIIAEDFDKDGKIDLLLAGNNHHAEVETTRADAGTGLFLKGMGGLNFEPIPSAKSGFFADKNVRDLKKIGTKILVGNNDDVLQVFEF